jgi:excinuclease UvrABC nuclease subunit
MARKKKTNTEREEIDLELLFDLLDEEVSDVLFELNFEIMKLLKLEEYEAAANIRDTIQQYIEDTSKVFCNLAKTNYDDSIKFFKNKNNKIREMFYQRLINKD